MDGFRTGYAYVNNIFCGTVCETDEGYSFKYDDEYLKRDDARAVSLTLPLTVREYQSNTLFPFFDGLIPEGWLLKVVGRNWKIDINDRFGVMLVACRDCIGNVCVRDERE